LILLDKKDSYSYANCLFSVKEQACEVPGSVDQGKVYAGTGAVDMGQGELVEIQEQGMGKVAWVECNLICTQFLLLDLLLKTRSSLHTTLYTLN